MGISDLKRMPILLLIVGLIGIGVGTASALVTITLAGDVNVEGILGIGINDAGNNDVIQFDDGSKTLQWDEAESRIEFNDDVNVADVLHAGGNTAPLGYHSFGSQPALPGQPISNENDLFVTADLASGLNIYAGDDLYVGTDDGNDDDTIFFDLGTTQFLEWNNTANSFVFSDDLSIGTDDGTDFDRIQFDGGGNIEMFVWNEPLDRFAVTDDFEIQGDLVCTGCVDETNIGSNAVGASEIIGVSKLIFGRCIEGVIGTFSPGDGTVINCTQAGVVTTDAVIGSITTVQSSCFFITKAFSPSAGDLEFIIRNGCGTTVGAGTVIISYIIFT